MLSVFPTGDFQLAENLLVTGLRCMGQGRLRLLAWSGFRPVREFEVNQAAIRRQSLANGGRFRAVFGGLKKR